jgi:hypothetical protein
MWKFCTETLCAVSLDVPSSPLIERSKNMNTASDARNPGFPKTPFLKPVKSQRCLEVTGQDRTGSDPFATSRTEAALSHYHRAVKFCII